MSKSIIAGLIATVQIAVFFIIILIIYNALGDSPLGQNTQANAVLESGKQATVDAFNWGLLIDTIGGIILIAGIIFGIIYAVIKIVENERGYSGGL